MNSVTVLGNIYKISDLVITERNKSKKIEIMIEYKDHWRDGQVKSHYLTFLVFGKKCEVIQRMKLGDSVLCVGNVQNRNPESTYHTLVLKNITNTVPTFLPNENQNFDQEAYDYYNSEMYNQINDDYLKAE